MSLPPPAPNPYARSTAASLPAIRPAVLPEIPGPRAIQYITVLLAAGSNTPIQIEGDFLYVATIAPESGMTYPLAVALSVKPDTSPAITIAAAPRTIRFPVSFKNLAIANDASNGVVTLTIACGFGDYSDEREPKPTSHLTFSTSYEFTRPNNVLAYAANQNVGTLATGLTFLNVIRTGQTTAIIKRARIIKDSTTTANAQFRLHLGTITDTFAAADQAAFLVTYAGRTQQFGTIDFPSFITGGAGSTAAYCEVAGLDLTIQSPGGVSSIVGHLESLAAYVPTALENFRVELSGYAF